MKLSTMELLKKANVDDSKYIHLEGDLLRNYQLALLKITDDIVDVCEEEHITYQLSGGSCLGAVRHKGFIPWDDDMDINMLGDHFDRFIAAFKKKYGDKYWIHTCHTKDYGLIVSRIRLKGSVLRIHQDVNNPEAGFFVDIFRLENTPDNPLLRRLHGTLCMGMGLCLSCRKFYQDRDIMRELGKNDKELMKSINFKVNFGRLLSFMSLTKWTELTQSCCSMSKNSHSKYLTIPAGRKHYFGELYLREGMENTVFADFEGRKWRIAKDYQGYLKKLYGDYMWIPPEEDREKHFVLELKFPGEKSIRKGTD